LLQKKQIGEDIRDLGLEGQLSKKGTPTMGGIIILVSILIPTLLFCDLTNIYVILLIISTIWLGVIGFIDDYIKVFRKNKEGMPGKYKIFGQVSLGLIVGIVLCFSDQVVVHEKGTPSKEEIAKIEQSTGTSYNPEHKSTKTTIPFVKENEFDYKWLAPGQGRVKDILGWIIYVIVIIFVITAVSNGTNLTDGMDGLATGISAIVGATLGILAYLSGNIIYSDYLNIMYLPDTGEVVIFMAVLVGALLGFLWYNSFPAQVFMGDTGSLALGGIIAVAAIVIRKELLIPILCGIFFVESLSVILQRGYFKYTKKKYGAGRRIFKMSPLHHHYQKEGIPALIQRPVKAIPEAKIVMRFWLVAILLAVITVVTLKIR
jgi:phospho-N-acetylmuramoyl-pentapeptide-transferase